MQLPTEMVIYLVYWHYSKMVFTLCLCYYNKLSDTKVGKKFFLIIKHTAHNKADTSPKEMRHFNLMDHKMNPKRPREVWCSSDFPEKIVNKISVTWVLLNMHEKRTKWICLNGQKNLINQRKANKKHFTDEVIFKNIFRHISLPVSKELIFWKEN